MMRYRQDRAVACLVLSAFVVLRVAELPQALAQGAHDYPLPSSASEVFSPIREGFTVPLNPRDDLRGPRLIEDWREDRLEDARQTRWSELPVFVRDSTLHLHSRTYWFDEDDFGFAEPKALTTGGSLSYASGYIANFFQLRSALYTTQPLYANDSAAATLNLSPDGDQITTLGQLNGRMRFGGHELTVGRQLVRTPYINPYDVRMIPLTFEGASLVPRAQGPDQTIDYIASYLTRYKPRDRADFVSFSNGLGVRQDEGVLIAGASYHKNGLNIGASNYWIKDTLNTAYGEIDYMLLGDRLNGDGPSVRVGLNYLDQRTVGGLLEQRIVDNEVIPGTPYETYQASARIVASYRGFVFDGALSRVGDQAGILKPFGFGTSYTATMVTNFQQAGVDAYLLSLSYDFAKLGFEGVKFKAAWGKGWGQNDPVTNDDFANQEEVALRLVYAPSKGRLQGLRVEVEYIDWKVFNDALPSEDLTQFRTIVNYTVPLL